MEGAVSGGTRTEAGPRTLSAGMSGRAMTERILKQADESGYQAALIDATQGTVTVWPRFAWMVRAAAYGLSRRGLAAGDTAGVFVQDAVSFAIAVNAVRAAGAMASPIRPDAGVADVAAQLNDCGARVLITAAPLAEIAAGAVERARVRQVFTFGDAPGTTSFHSLLGTANHCADGRGADDELAAPDGAAEAAEGGQPGLGLGHRDVVVAGPPCGEGQAYTSLLDRTMAAGATIVAAPVPLITAAIRVYKGTAAIVPRDIDVPGLPPERVFGVA